MVPVLTQFSKLLPLIIGGGRSCLPLAWAIQVSVRVVVYAAVDLSPRLCCASLILFHTCPGGGWAWGLHGFKHGTGRSPSWLLWGIFSGTLFYISSGQKDGLLLDFSIHAFQQFHLTKVKWREKEGRKRIIRIFSLTRHSRALSLVLVPLSRETGFLLRYQVLASLCCHQHSCTDGSGVAGRDGREQKEAWFPLHHYPANREPFPWASGQTDGILLELSQSTPTRQFPDLAHLQLKARK